MPTANGAGGTCELSGTGEWRLRAPYLGFTLPDHPMTYDYDRGRTLLMTRAYETVAGEVGYISRSDVWEWRYVDEPPMCEPAP